MRIAFFAMLLSLLTTPSSGHQCVLSGTDASEITIYNACKNDLLMGVDGHASSADVANSTNKNPSQRLILLEAENKRLQAKLDLLRIHLLDLIKNL